MRPTTALLPIALVALTGCLHEEDLAAEVVDTTPVPVAAPLVERQVTVAADEAPPPPTALTPGGVLAAPSRDPVRFQIGAAYGALSQVDLEACRDRGLPSGYVRVRATFTRSGYIVRASIESVTPPSPQALDCIADGLRQTGVPAFDGAEARLSKTYFVEPSATAGAPD
jgi:hypothetical protein